ncbi:MAG TPA: hypothetical protein VMP10_03275 [Chloroflexota bacterium]|nr:hypothetical protein [Chloroflexota bacterium]
MNHFDLTERTRHSLTIIRRPFRLLNQGPTNDCGPFATTMALHALGLSTLPVDSVKDVMRLWRVPGIGATTPRAIHRALRGFDARGRGGWFGSIGDLRAAIDSDLPSLVIVRPTDSHLCTWNALHYRVVVGYALDIDAPGGGWLYFACSSAPQQPIFPDSAAAPANVVLSFTDFERQWRTWATWRWHLTIEADFAIRAPAE